MYMFSMSLTLHEFHGVSTPHRENFYHREYLTHGETVCKVNIRSQPHQRNRIYTMLNPEDMTNDQLVAMYNELSFDIFDAFFHAEQLDAVKAELKKRIKNRTITEEEL